MEIMKFWRRVCGWLKPTKRIVVQLSPEQEIRFKGGVPLPPIPSNAIPVPMHCPTCGKALGKRGDVPLCSSCSVLWCPRCGAKLWGSEVTQCHNCHVAWCAGCFRIPEFYVRHRLGISMPCCGRLGEQIIRGIS